MPTIRAGVLGATGYAGLETLRILLNHPQAEPVAAVSQSFAGKPLSSVYPGYLPCDMPLEPLNVEKIARECDVAFLALPHGLSMDAAKSLVEAGVRVIDLSGDYRYDSVETYREWYGVEHRYPELNSEAVYGVCELYRDKIKTARLLANPGCYTTCSIMALYPLLKVGAISPHNLIIDAKSGATGAGRQEKSAYSFCELDENFKAYGLCTHRHTSEIEQELAKAAGTEVVLSFTPHLLPVKRGILATIYANTNGRLTRDDVLECYNMYKNEQFVHIYATGTPELKHVAQTNNFCAGFELDPRLERIIIVACIDNLGKGAAGQAVQNMNIMFGLPEESGLNKAGVNL